MTKRKIVKCNQFGWGFSNEDDLCDNCLTRKECANLSVDAHLKKAQGHKPNIPINKTDSGKPMSVRVELPVIRNNKLKLTFYIEISMDWFRKYFGSRDYT